MSCAEGLIPPAHLSSANVDDDNSLASRCDSDFTLPRDYDTAPITTTANGCTPFGAFDATTRTRYAPTTADDMVTISTLFRASNAVVPAGAFPT